MTNDPLELLTGRLIASVQAQSGSPVRDNGGDRRARRIRAARRRERRCA